MSATLDFFPSTKLCRVISASRRTDMVATDPDGLVDVLQQKAPPTETHTVVLWTKDPRPILHHPGLNSQLKKYDQCYVHLTITGMGGSMLEPRVPKPVFVLETIPALIDFIGTPERLNLRFDPIVHFRLKDGTTMCNLDFFLGLALVLEKHQMRNVTTSWVQIYGKVAKRLTERGIIAKELSVQQQKSESDWLRKIAEKHKLTLHGCCVPGWPRSQCINGELLNNLHPRGLKTSTAHAGGQRPLCGCTKSLDIGWYTACVHGCLYCYGNPKLYS